MVLRNFKKFSLIKRTFAVVSEILGHFSQGNEVLSAQESFIAIRKSEKT